MDNINIFNSEEKKILCTSENAINFIRNYKNDNIYD